VARANFYRYGGQLLASYEYSPFNYCKYSTGSEGNFLTQSLSGRVSGGCARQHQRWPVVIVWSQ
jgi:hypothetical protein